MAIEAPNNTLKVTVASGKYLRAKKKTSRAYDQLLAEVELKSYPVLTLKKTGEEQRGTPIAGSAPQWGQSFEFKATLGKNDILLVEIFDEPSSESGSGDGKLTAANSLGTATVKGLNLESHGWYELNFADFSPKGDSKPKIYVSTEYVINKAPEEAPPTAKDTVVKKAMEETKGIVQDVKETTGEGVEKAKGGVEETKGEDGEEAKKTKSRVKEAKETKGGVDEKMGKGVEEAKGKGVEEAKGEGVETAKGEGVEETKGEGGKEAKGEGGKEAKGEGGKEAKGECGKDVFDRTLGHLSGPRHQCLRSEWYYENCKGAYRFVAEAPVIGLFAPVVETVAETALSITPFAKSEPDEGGEVVKSVEKLDKHFTGALNGLDNALDNGKDSCIDGVLSVKDNIKGFNPDDKPVHEAVFDVAWEAPGVAVGAVTHVAGTALAIPGKAVGAVGGVIGGVWNSLTGGGGKEADKSAEEKDKATEEMTPEETAAATEGEREGKEGKERATEGDKKKSATPISPPVVALV